MGIKNFEIDDDLKVNVKGNVVIPLSQTKINVHGKNVTTTVFGDSHSLPFKFGIVQGDFQAAHCNFDSMVNMPDEVGGDFNIGSNNITTLDGIPRKIGGNFHLNELEIKSLYVPYNVIIKGKTFMKNFPKLEPEELSVFINYQHYYNVYDDYGEINKEEAKILIQEIHEGLR